VAPALAAALCALALGCGPVPGGALSGEVAPAPAAWSDALGGDRAMCEIEARPADPHSIQLECFTREGALYVQSHRWALAEWWRKLGGGVVRADARASAGTSTTARRARHRRRAA
jgi:hypothetical protein